MIGGESLPQVEEFKYLRVSFTSERRMDRRIGAAAAVMQSLYRSVVVNRELSRKAKLSMDYNLWTSGKTSSSVRGKGANFSSLAREGEYNAREAGIMAHDRALGALFSLSLQYSIVKENSFRHNAQ